VSCLGTIDLKISQNLSPGKAMASVTGYVTAGTNPYVDKRAVVSGGTGLVSGHWSFHEFRKIITWKMGDRQRHDQRTELRNPAIGRGHLINDQG
jgi:hypothetical protein